MLAPEPLLILISKCLLNFRNQANPFRTDPTNGFCT